MSYKNRMICRTTSKGAPDFYSTPKWATLALMKREKFKGTIVEPACGNGRMSRVIKKFNPVRSYDLHNWGYGRTGVDFLKRKWKLQDNIITNPPFKLAEEFIWKALEITKYKVAFLLRINFLSSQRRYKMFLKTPLKRVWIFCRRVPFGKPGHKLGRMIIYCWVIWDKKYKGKPQIGWIHD